MARLISLLLVGHATMHVGAVACGLLFAATPSWITTGLGPDLSAIKAAAIVLTAVTMTGYLLAAMAVAGFLVPRSWCRSTSILATVTSIALLVALFSLPAVPGLVIDAILLWGIVGRSWQPTPTFGG